MHSNEEAIDSPSPSFNSYFNTDLADVVARVATEFVTVDDDFFSSNETCSQQSEDVEADGDFEFNLLAPADGDFEFNLLDPADGEYCHAYPVFDRGLLRDYDLVGQVYSRPSDLEKEFSRSQIQLKNLFLEDREANRPSLTSSSSSSSEEEDDLDEIPDGTYCVWMPSKSRLASPGRCRKSNSTGSVKACKLRDLLKRCKSDGKDRSGMILLTPKKKKQETAMATGAVAAKKRSRMDSEKNKRQSYLPYRQDLIAFSVSPKAFRKVNLLPFS